MYPYFEFNVSHIYHMQTVSLLPLLLVWGVKWTFIWNFRISINRNTEISLNHYDISKSTYPLSENQITEPVGACGLGTVWYQSIGIHHGGRWQPVPKQFISPKVIVMLVEEN